MAAESRKPDLIFQLMAGTGRPVNAIMETLRGY
jgi:hypothetical protein